MATRVTWNRSGCKVSCETSKRPLPKTRFAHPIPDIGLTAHPCISADVEYDSTTKLASIVVSTVDPAGLSSLYSWRLRHSSMSGDWTGAWEAFAIPSGPMTFSLPHPRAGCPHYFALERRTPAGIVDVFPTVEASLPIFYGLARVDGANLAAKSISQEALANPNTDNLVPNPNCELGAVAGIGGALVVQDPENSYAGDYVRRVDMSTTDLYYLTEKLPCVPGDRYFLEARMKVSNSSAALALMLIWQSAAGVILASTSVACCSDTSYASAAMGGTGTAPEGAVWVQAATQASLTAQDESGYLDALQVRRLVPQAVVGGAVTYTYSPSAPQGYTFIVPEGVYLLKKVTAVGPGGGGAGGGSAHGGGGGGAGAVAVTSLAVKPGDMVQVIPGAPGTGGAYGADGTAGGDTLVYLNTDLVISAGGGHNGESATGHGGQGGRIQVRDGLPVNGLAGGALGENGAGLVCPYVSELYGSAYPGTGGAGSPDGVHITSGGPTGTVLGGSCNDILGGGGGAASAMAKGGTGGWNHTLAPAGYPGNDGSGGGGGSKGAGAGAAGGKGWVKIEY